MGKGRLSKEATKYILDHPEMSEEDLAKAVDKTVKAVRKVRSITTSEVTKARNPMVDSARIVDSRTGSPAGAIMTSGLSAVGDTQPKSTKYSDAIHKPLG